MTDTEAIFREIGVAPTLFPPQMLRHLEAVFRAVDQTGRLTDRTARPFRTPLVLRWAPGGTDRQWTGRAGIVTLVTAHCLTAPTTGDAVVTFTMERREGGVQNLGTLTIPEGQTMADETLNVAVPSSAWLAQSVTTANGASGVSVAAMIDLGAS